MKKTFKTQKSSEIVKKINALNLTPISRAQAIAALESADRVSNLLSGIVRKLQQFAVSVLPSRVAVGSKLKHQ